MAVKKRGDVSKLLGTSPLLLGFTEVNQLFLMLGVIET